MSTLPTQLLMRHLQNLPMRQKQRALYEELNADIRSGKLTDNTQLPSSRELAEQLGVSRSTVQTVYETLVAEGFLQTRQGAGTFVSHSWAYTPDTQTPHRTPSTVPAPPQGRSSLLPLLPAQPDLKHFPTALWQRLQRQALRDNDLFAFPDIQGDLPLRQALASFLQRYRGVSCLPEQIFITSGSQQALSYALMAITQPQQSVHIEEIGYPGIDRLLTQLNLNARTLSAICAETLQINKPQCLLLTPSRTFPLGTTLSAEARQTLLRWIENNPKGKLWLIEDDYDSDFTFNGRSLAALQGMAPHTQIIYTGTFSRALYPGIRIGYLVVPAHLVDKIKQIRKALEGGLNSQQQRVLALWIEQGHYERHLRRMRKLYQQRQLAQRNCVAQHLPELRLQPQNGGMHDTYYLPQTWLDAGLTDQLIVDSAASQLGVRALSHYSRITPKHQGLIIGFAGQDEEQSERGIILLKSLIGLLIVHKKSDIP